MKRKPAALMALALSAALIFMLLAGCGQGAQGTPAPAAGTPAADTPAAETPAASTDQPAAEAEPVTLTYWSDLGMGKGIGAVKTLAENTVWQTLQEKFNVTIEFQHPPADSGGEQFNLIIASGQYPDLMEYQWVENVPGGPAGLLQSGVIIPLNDAISQWAPNLTKFYADFEEIRKEQELDDGTYYVFPSVYGDDTTRYAGGPIIRMDWLTKLGLEVPTTIDEWTEMLRAVKGVDLNENGEDDEIPFFFANVDEMTSIPAIGSAFGVTGPSWGSGFLQDNGRVYYSCIEPSYKEYLTLLNMWYSEGLIDPESLVANSQLKTEKYTSNRVFAIPGYMGGSITTYSNMMKDNVPGFQMMPTTYPTLKKGDEPILSTREFAYNGSGVAITSACQNVEIATKMLDNGYGEEGQMLMLFGIEGESYTMVDGVPTYTDLILNNPDGLSNLQAMAKYCYWQSSAPCAKTGLVVNQRDRLPEQIEGRKRWMQSKNDVLLPHVTPSTEESREMATIMTDVETYAKEMFNQFVSGQTPISEFDTYVNTIKSMGIDRAIELTQAQVDRFADKP